PRHRNAAWRGAGRRPRERSSHHGQGHRARGCGMTRLSLAFTDLWPTATRRRDEQLRFNLQELSGSLGDLGTFLPLSVAMALTCGLDIGLIFIFAGLMNVITGVVFRQPIPVQ